MSYVHDCNTASIESELMAMQRPLPSDWAPMASNTELFEVDLASSAVQELVAAVNRTGATVVKVRRHLWNKVITISRKKIKGYAIWAFEDALAIRPGSLETPVSGVLDLVIQFLALESDAFLSLVPLLWNQMVPRSGIRCL